LVLDFPLVRVRDHPCRTLLLLLHHLLLLTKSSFPDRAIASYAEIEYDFRRTSSLDVGNQ
jgi:hypothetical protein